MRPLRDRESVCVADARAVGLEVPQDAGLRPTLSAQSPSRSRHFPSAIWPIACVESERQASWVELWESLCDPPEAVPRTDAQRTELDSRLDDLEQDAPTGIPWDDVVRRIRNSR